MKRFLMLFASAIIMIGALQSCNDCRGIDCDNGGTCNDGTCDCLKGYSGDNCEESDVCILNDVECNFGECDEGICFCNDGYELIDCSREAREKFIGRFDVQESVIPLDTLFTQIELERDPLSVPDFWIANMFNFNQFPIKGYFSRIKARANPNTKGFTIARQGPDGTDKQIEGSGNIIGSPDDSTFIEINITYTVYDGNQEYTGIVKGNLIP